MDLYDLVVSEWNKHADEFNQWCSLSEEEKVEFAFDFGQTCCLSAVDAKGDIGGDREGNN